MGAWSSPTTSACSMVEPDVVHVMYEGRIVKEGGKGAADQLEAEGAGWIKEEVEAAA